MTSRPIPSERSFGLSVGGVLTAIGTLSWLWRGHAVAGPTLLAAGVFLLLGGLAAPRALGVPNRIWWRFAQALGWFNARLLLTLFFGLVLTPAGFVMRLLGRNPLAAAGKTSNWVAYAARRGDPKHYEHMF